MTVGDCEPKCCKLLQLGKKFITKMPPATACLNKASLSPSRRFPVESISGCSIKNPKTIFGKTEVPLGRLKKYKLTLISKMGQASNATRHSSFAGPADP